MKLPLAYITISKNYCKIALTVMDGGNCKQVGFYSAGSCGFRGAKTGTEFAGQKVGYTAGR